MSKFWSPIVSDLTPYTPGEQPRVNGLIKLNTNESPYGPSPQAIAAMRNEMGDGLRLYPSPDSAALKAVLAERAGLTVDHVFVGNGSDEVLAHAFQALLQHNLPILYPDISYSFYPTYCRLYRIEAHRIPLAADFTVDVDDYVNFEPHIGGIVFPNPNAPTGVLLPLAQIERLLQGRPDTVVLVDEAYIDFGGESALSLVHKYPNLLVVQTLSKSRSLAGLRVGFAIGHPDLISGIERVKNSFNSYPLDRIAIAGAIAAMRDEAYFEEKRQAIISTRTKLSEQLQALGFEVLPSAANFVFVRHPLHDARTLAAYLRTENIIVRHFSQARIDQFLRITIGSDSDCKAVIDVLRRYFLTL